MFSLPMRTVFTMSALSPIFALASISMMLVSFNDLFFFSMILFLISLLSFALGFAFIKYANNINSGESPTSQEICGVAIDNQWIS